jgi:hypothetical protein
MATRLFPKSVPRQKGWPKWAKRIHNLTCGCRLFSLGHDAVNQDACPVKFLVHCARDKAPGHKYSSYTTIKD